MALSQKVKSIGFRTTGGMALLLISVVLVAVVGIRGMGSLTGAVTQTVDTSKVLIGANKAEGAIIQYLVSKDPKWIDEAVGALDTAQSKLNALALSTSEKSELSSGIAKTSDAVKALAASQDTVQKAGTALRDAAGSMVTLAEQTEKTSQDIASQAETNSNNALVTLNSIAFSFRTPAPSMKASTRSSLRWFVPQAKALRSLPRSLPNRWRVPRQALPKS